jgi:hypothetical protein
MKASVTPVFFFLLLIASSCKKENMCDCLKSTGNVVTEKRVLADFHAMEVRKNVIVTLVQDTLNYAEIEAGSQLIDLIETEVVDGILKISNNNICNWVRSYDVEVNVRVHLKSISSIEHFGSGEIRCANVLIIDQLDVRENNSADIKLNLRARRVFARLMNGGGDIYLDGQSDFCYAYSASFGYIYARNLTADSVQVDHRGSGDMHVHPVNWFSVYLADRGDVYYRGNPQYVGSVLDGIGRLIKE